MYSIVGKDGHSKQRTFTPLIDRQRSIDTAARMLRHFDLSGLDIDTRHRIEPDCRQILHDIEFHHESGTRRIHDSAKRTQEQIEISHLSRFRD